MDEEEHKSYMVARLRELEQHHVTHEYVEQMAMKAKESVEAEFMKSVTALVERKKALWDEIELKLQEEENNKQTRHQLVKACKQSLEAGATTYAFNKLAGKQVWKIAAEVKKPRALQSVVLEFPSVSLPEFLSTHGSVTSVVHTPFSLAGPVSTMAGAANKGNADGNGPNANFDGPVYVCVNPVDNCLYLTEVNNNVIRRVTEQGDVTTFAATKGDSQLDNPYGIGFSKIENCFYVCSTEHHLVKKIALDGTITTFAGSGTRASVDGVGTEASFDTPRGLAIDQRTGNIFVNDNNSYKIRKITPKGEVSTVAGTGKRGFADGSPLEAIFSDIGGICYDERDDSLLICDFGNNKLRKVDFRQGKVETLCTIATALGIAITRTGLYIATSMYSHKAFIVTLKDGKYEARLIAGSDSSGSDDGEALVSRFNAPYGIAVNPNTNKCFICDVFNNKIRQFALL